MEWAALIRAPKALWSGFRGLFTIRAREEVVQCREELATLRERNEELKKLLAFQGTLERRGDTYWSVKGGAEDGPYCMHCLDLPERKAIHLYYNNDSSWRCPECDKVARRPGRDGWDRPIRRNMPVV